MTAAQKENIKRFKAVQAEAKKLKAKNKKLTHQEAVKQAWAIMYSKQKSGKKVGAVKKKAAPKPSEKDILKKVHSAKASSKTLYNKLDKLDEAQHKHMSGITHDRSKILHYWESVYGRLAADYISAKTVKDKNIIRKEMNIAKAIISTLKKSKL